MTGSPKTPVQESAGKMASNRRRGPVSAESLDTVLSRLEATHQRIHSIQESLKLHGTTGEFEMDGVTKAHRALVLLEGFADNLETAASRMWMVQSHLKGKQ